MNSTKLKRRAFLRGLGGVTLALPLLELVNAGRAGAASAAAPAKRYVFMYGGISTGRRMGDSTADPITPTTTGHGFEQTPALAPLFEQGVEGDVSIVSGLKVPWGPDSAVPPGGRGLQFHYLSVTPQISGTRSYESGSRIPKAPTSDQIVADAIAADTPHRLLVYRAQPASYVGDNSKDGSGGHISYAAKDGKISAVDPVVSPRVAFESLFGSFVPADPAQKAEAEFELGRRKSVLDLVRRSTQELLPKLGKADKLRMEQHFDEIRALEQRIELLTSLEGGSSCVSPEDPGQDPPIGGAIAGADNVYSTSSGYSNEELRAQILEDLVAMAFSCDLARVASLQLTTWKCYMNMYEVTGYSDDMHGLTHSGSMDRLAAGIAWLVKHFGRMTARLKELKDVDGSPLLDHSALVMVFEGGHGFDPEGSQLGSHSTENMVALIGGRAGGLSPGQHVVAKDKHPAQVVASAMQAVGGPGDLNEVKGTLPQLFA